MRPQCGIATDGAHSTKNRLTRFQAVDIATGEVLFNESIGNQTINIGEFLGVVEAVKYIIDHNYTPRIIYTDSMTAISWFQAKRTASKKSHPAFATEIESIEVRHWDNAGWGETPADFGEKS